MMIVLESDQNKSSHAGIVFVVLRLLFFINVYLIRETKNCSWFRHFAKTRVDIDKTAIQTEIDRRFCRISD